MSDAGGVTVEIGGMDCLEMLGGAAVNAGLPGCRHLGLDGVPDQRVRELGRWRPGCNADEPGGGGGIDLGQDGTRGQPADRAAIPPSLKS